MIALAVAGKVIVVVITSSPVGKSLAEIARWSPAVHELSPIAWVDSVYFLKSSSNWKVRGPVVNQPDLRVSTTSLISSSSQMAKRKLRLHSEKTS